MMQDESAKSHIKNWWAANPMTYAKEHGTLVYQIESEREEHELGTKEFFDRADETFLKWNKPLHKPGTPFAKLFDYQRFAARNVLEVGCGMGFMAMNWARQGANVFAADLNPVAVRQTSQRFKLFNLAGSVVQMDAEELPFRAESFAYCYSWGVVHHTPGIQLAINQMYRLLEPGGEIGLMLYNRGSLKHRYLTEYVEGYLHMENEFLTPLQLASRYGDGHNKEGNPHTWPVTEMEVRNTLLVQFEDVKVHILGTEMGNLLDLFIPGLGSYLMPMPMKKALARRWGWSLWITARKPA